MNTHSDYVILLAFPQQQWLCERASLLHYTCISCPARIFVNCWFLFFIGVISFCLSFYLC